MTSSCPQPPDMDDCKTKKKRCLNGPCVGFTYTAGQECGANSVFNPSTCECDPVPPETTPGVWHIRQDVDRQAGYTPYSACYAVEIPEPYFNGSGEYVERIIGHRTTLETTGQIQPNGYGTIPECNGTNSSLSPGAPSRSVTIESCEDAFGDPRPDNYSRGTANGAIQVTSLVDGCATSLGTSVGLTILRAYCDGTSFNTYTSTADHTLTYMGTGSVPDYFPGASEGSGGVWYVGNCS